MAWRDLTVFIDSWHPSNRLIVSFESRHSQHQIVQKFTPPSGRCVENMEKAFDFTIKAIPKYSRLSISDFECIWEKHFNWNCEVKCMRQSATASVKMCLVRALNGQLKSESRHCSGVVQIDKEASECNLQISNHSWPRFYSWEASFVASENAKAYCQSICSKATLQNNGGSNIMAKSKLRWLQYARASFSYSSASVQILERGVSWG